MVQLNGLVKAGFLLAFVFKRVTKNSLRSPSNFQFTWTSQVDFMPNDVT